MNRTWVFKLAVTGANGTHRRPGWLRRAGAAGRGLQARRDRSDGRLAHLTEDPIGAALNGPAGGPADGTADSVLGGVPPGPVRPRDPGRPGRALLAVAEDLSYRATDWMAGRRLTATSVSGIALALGICAAAWFTAGTRPDNVSGVLALAAGYLTILAARRLTGPADQASAADPEAARPAWLAGLATRIFEYVVLAGLTVGAAAQGWAGMWPLGIGVLSLVSIHDTMTACSAARGGAAARPSPTNRAALAVLTMPVGGRVLVIAVVAPVWGARAVLVGLLDWAIIAIGIGIVLGSRTRRAAPEEGPGRRRFRRRDAGPPAGGPRPAGGPAQSAPPSLAVLLKPTRPVPPPESPVMAPGREPISVLRMELTAAPPPATAQDTQEFWLGDTGDTGEAAAAESGGPGAWDYDPGADYDDAGPEPPGGIRLPAALAVIARCRDDGVISRWVGGLVRGQLTPLPPALVALTAVAVLAHLGLRDLPGFLTLAPPIMMLVAAPGSSHWHDGRLDWLVPAVLMGAQYIYIAALGFASGVPAAVTFLLAAAVAVRYADLGSPGSPPSRRPEWLGWEGRMLVCGLGAAMGVAMFAYLALAAYLAVLLGSKVVTGYSGSREGDIQ
jgi:hypothetical protein